MEFKSLSRSLYIILTLGEAYLESLPERPQALSDPLVVYQPAPNSPEYANMRRELHDRLVLLVTDEERDKLRAEIAEESVLKFTGDPIERAKLVNASDIDEKVHEGIQ
jgi:hypothetical protein